MYIVGPKRVNRSNSGIKLSDKHVVLITRAMSLVYSSFNSGNLQLLDSVLDAMCSKNCKFIFLKNKVSRSGVTYGKIFFSEFLSLFPGKNY